MGVERTISLPGAGAGNCPDERVVELLNCGSFHPGKLRNLLRAAADEVVADVQNLTYNMTIIIVTC